MFLARRARAAANPVVFFPLRVRSDANFDTLARRRPRFGETICASPGRPCCATCPFGGVRIAPCYVARLSRKE
jgi:hypothetical protein